MRLAIPILALTVATPTALLAQETTIQRGQSISRTLDSASTHRFAIDLGSRTFVYGEADQLTVDVVVRILDPRGEELRNFDAPSRGPEKFTFESDSAGRYVIEVSPFEEQTGDYILTIRHTERVATNPRNRVDQLMMPFADEETPGAVVGVVSGGRLAFTKGYGMANLEHDIPFEVGTISNIGSVTKQFTAMGLLLLEQRGKLSLSDDIRKHVPELPDFGVPITLKNLLNHTGGFREVYNLMPMTGYSGEDALAREKVIQIVQRQPDLQSQPNTEYNYNNTGYILLAETIERVSGMTFPEYMKANVFEPLGMTSTRVKAYQGQIIPGRAAGYVPAENGGYRSTRDLAASYGAGGIYTTVQDLSRWMLNYRDKTLGGPEAVAAITTNTILESGDSTGYGLGLGLGTFRGRTRWQHTGGDVAHRTYFGYFPELESGVIVMSNNGSFSLGVSGEIAEAFFESQLDPEEEDNDEDIVAGDGMSEERVEAIAGLWRIVSPAASLNIEYTVEDGSLHAQATGQPQFSLNTTSDSTAEFIGVPASVTFHFKPDNTVDSATHHQGGSVPMMRVEADPPTTDDLMKLVGQYYSEEIETRFDIRLEGDSLVMYNIRMSPLRLEHQQGDEFTAPSSPFATIEFRRSGSGRVTGFMAANGRTRDVWFRKQ